MRSRKPESAAIRSSRLEAALERAVTAGDGAELFELLTRSSGLPGPKANLELARAIGLAIAGYGGRADALVRALLKADSEYLRIVAALALAARSLAGVDAKGALDDLSTLAEDPHHQVRSGVVAALRARIAARGEAEIKDLATWTDGYLQAHVVLQALADRPLLDALPRGDEVLARLDEAFALADLSPRAAERLQGVRALRDGMAASIAVFAARFPETIEWVLRKAASKRPETREVVAQTISALRRAKLSDAEAQRLGDALDASAPLRRDADRVVHGTRNRSKGRR